MPRSWLTCGALTFALAASASIARTALAQDEVGEEAEEASPAPGDKGSRKPQVIFAPVPFSSPASGTGLAAGAVAFYNPNDTPHQWITGGGVVWTSRGTKGVAAFHKMASTSDRFRLNGARRRGCSIDACSWGCRAAGSRRGAAAASTCAAPGARACRPAAKRSRRAGSAGSTAARASSSSSTAAGRWPRPSKPPSTSRPRSPPSPAASRSTRSRRR